MKKSRFTEEQIIGVLRKGRGFLGLLGDAVRLARAWR